MSFDFRALLRGEFSWEWIRDKLYELAGATKTQSVPITCKHCERQGKYDVEVRDLATQFKAVQFISENGYGKAPAARQDDSKPLPTDVDPTTMTSTDRQQLIAQLKAKLDTGKDGDISVAL